MDCYQSSRLAELLSIQVSTGAKVRFVSLNLTPFHWQSFCMMITGISSNQNLDHATTNRNESKARTLFTRGVVRSSYYFHIILEFSTLLETWQVQSFPSLYESVSCCSAHSDFRKCPSGSVNESPRRRYALKAASKRHTPHGSRRREKGQGDSNSTPNDSSYLGQCRQCQLCFDKWRQITRNS